MSKLRVGHLVRHRDDDRRRGRVVSANVNALDHLGRILVEWTPSGRITAIHRSLLVLDDHPLRGRDVRAERSIDSWQEML